MPIDGFTNYANRHVKQIQQKSLVLAFEHIVLVLGSLVQGPSRSAKLDARCCADLMINCGRLLNGIYNFRLHKYDMAHII